MTKLPEARIAGGDHRNVLLRGIGLALAIAVAAAMMEANAIGATIVLALVGGLCLHRRYVVDRREPAPRVLKALPPVREQAQRVRAAVLPSC